MDLSANEAFLLCKRFYEKGWVQVGDGEEEGAGYADGGPATGASGGAGNLFSFPPVLCCLSLLLLLLSSH